MKVSVIDIGSNTVKATVFSVSRTGRKSIVGYKGFKTKLISNIREENEKRFLDADGCNKLYEALDSLIAFSNDNECDNIYAFATASLRGVENSGEILKHIKEKFDLDVDILSGDEEALCSLKGLLNSEYCEDVHEGVMVDMGGGSTELVHFSNGLEPLIISLPFGCLSLFNNFVKDNVPTTDEEKKIKEFVIKHLEKCAFAKSKRIPMYFIGGSGRAIQKVLLSELNKKNISIDGSDFDFVVEKYRDKLFFENAENITPGRSNTVAPAAIAYKCIVNFIEPSSIIVSESGVREGYLEKILP